MTEALAPSIAAALSRVRERLSTLDKKTDSPETARVRATSDRLSGALVVAQNRIQAIDQELGRLHDGPNPGAVADALQRGDDVLAATGSTTLLREERSAIMAGLPELARRAKAHEDILQGHHLEDHRRAKAIVEDELSPAIEEEIRRCAAHLASLYAIARAVDHPLSAAVGTRWGVSSRPGKTADALNDALVALRNARHKHGGDLVEVEKTLPVPDEISSAFEPAASILTAINAWLPGTVPFPERVTRTDIL